MDENLGRVIRWVLFGDLFIHIVMSIWVYGNPDLYDTDDSIKSKNSIFNAVENGKKYVFTTFGYRATATHCIPLLAILSTIVVGFGVYMFDPDLFQRILDFVVRRGRKVKPISGKEKNYFDSNNIERSNFVVLSSREIEDELIFLDKRLSEAQNPEYKKYLLDRKEKFTNLLNEKSTNVKNQTVDFTNKFVGPPSYFIGVFILHLIISISLMKTIKNIVFKRELSSIQ
jgi:acetolactate synthase regulatory subunit